MYCAVVKHASMLRDRVSFPTLKGLDIQVGNTMPCFKKESDI